MAEAIRVEPVKLKATKTKIALDGRTESARERWEAVR